MARKKSFLEQSIATPACALDALAHSIRAAQRMIERRGGLKKAKQYWRLLGPGFTAGAADDDPSGIATYSQAGATYGPHLLWAAPLTYPLMATIQEICARIGMVTGKGLAANIRDHYSKPVLVLCTTLLFVANTFNIGVDLGAMAKATQLILPELPFPLLVVGFAAFCLGLQIFSAYERYARYLKYLALVLITYIISALLIPQVDWQALFFYTITPFSDFSKEQVLLLCAIFGTTISPYLFFWQTAQEVEQEIAHGRVLLIQRQGATKREIRKMRIDVWSGMLLSNIVMYFIIAACAATLYTGSGETTIATADQAAQALRPLAGDLSYFFFALGIIGTGLLAVPVLAGSVSYAIAEAFNWKSGLSKKLNQAQSFYGVLILAMLIGLAVNFSNVDPIKALVYAAIANGITAPILLIVAVSMSSNEKIMGKWKNSRTTRTIGWLTVALMSTTGLSTLWLLIFD